LKHLQKKKKRYIIGLVVCFLAIGIISLWQMFEFTFFGDIQGLEHIPMRYDAIISHMGEPHLRETNVRDDGRESHWSQFPVYSII